MFDGLKADPSLVTDDDFGEKEKEVRIEVSDAYGRLVIFHRIEYQNSDMLIVRFTILNTTTPCLPELRVDDREGGRARGTESRGSLGGGLHAGKVVHGKLLTSLTTPSISAAPLAPRTPVNFVQIARFIPNNAHITLAMPRRR